jgi:hypothetical protein
VNPDREKFLNLKRTPARLSVEETAWCLGFSAHDIPILISRGLLKPLGHPSGNTVKYFATTVIEALRADVKWLGKATDILTEHWRDKNNRRSAEMEKTFPVVVDENGR